jgi:carbon monoxide dehydrogenase subunit G
VKIAGQHTIGTGRQQVWDALQDPAVLARTLPGCQTLEVTGPHAYAATITAGVASVKGTYQGQVSLADIQAPTSYTLVATGAGAPGTVRAEAKVRLEESDGATTVHYDADAVVGGMIGGVGQRMLASVAKRTAGEFFTAVEQELLHGPVPVEPAATAPGVAPAASAEAPSTADGQQHAEVQPGKVFHATASRPGASADDRRIRELGIALLAGAVIALLGVLVGRRSAR